MIYFEHKDGDVTVIHYMPFHAVHGLGKSKEELEQTGFFVASVPDEEFVQGKISKLKFNEGMGELYYEYVDAPPSEQDKLAQLEKRQELIQQMLDELILGGM